MNADQCEAVRRVLDMRDYALVLGMPGTGKTTTILHVIKVRRKSSNVQSCCQRSKSIEPVLFMTPPTLIFLPNILV